MAIDLREVDGQILSIGTNGLDDTDCAVSHGSPFVLGHFHRIPDSNSIANANQIRTTRYRSRSCRSHSRSRNSATIDGSRGAITGLLGATRSGGTAPRSSSGGRGRGGDISRHPAKKESRIDSFQVPLDRGETNLPHVQIPCMRPNPTRFAVKMYK